MTQDKPLSTAVAGWTGFAGFMMLLTGFWWIVAGLVGVLNDDIFVESSKYVFKFSTSAWGWIHLILGLLVFVAGIAVFRGEVWARTVGVVMATISAMIGFIWLPAYPVWAVILIVTSVFVIWALTVHGHEVAEGYHEAHELDEGYRKA